MTFVIYDETGRIVQTASVADPASYRTLLEKRGLSFIEVSHDPSVGYVVDGALRMRPASTAALDKTTIEAGQSVTLSGLVPGARVSITGPATQTFTAEVDAADLTFVLPGTYEIAIEAFPQRDARFTVEVRQ